jgi:hypothetical protein
MSGALKLPPAQAHLQTAAEALAAAERALSYSLPAIQPRPSEAERLVAIAVQQLKMARCELAALFDARVNSDSLYGERSHG